LKSSRSPADEPDMASWTKKISKVAPLEPGERLVEGVLLQPSGTTGQMVAKGVGGMIGKAVASKLGGGTATELVTDSGIAATMPTTKTTVLGLTDRRLLVFGHGSLSGKPKDLELAIPTDDLVSVDVEKQKATYRFVLHFADGTSSIYEAPRLANDPEAFAAAVAAR
jgi:hypothetical protein